MHIDTPAVGQIIMPALPFAHDGLSCGMGSKPIVRSHRVSVSMLGDAKHKTNWPSRMKLGLVFPKGAKPRELIERLLRSSGHEFSDELREVYPLPASPLACRSIAVDSARFVNAETDNPQDVLRQALLLGLCGEHFYDPLRPIIWTNKRLVRKVELFQVGDFYADN